MTQQKKTNVPGVQLSPSTIPKQVDRSSFPSVGSAFRKTIGNTLLNMGFDAVGSVIGGAISNYYNKKAEERADARYRDLLRDTPKITADARRSAGLNPYGDPTLPGQVAQSTPDTASVGQGSFQRATAQTLEELVAMKRLDNETLVAEAQANEANANADRLRGLEGRDTKLFPQVFRAKMEEIRGIQLANDYQSMVNWVYDATKGDKVEESRYSVYQLVQAIEAGRVAIENAIKDGNLKDEELEIMKANQRLLTAQAIREEIAGRKDAFDFTQWTGSTLSGEHVGTGLAQVAYDKATYERDIAEYTKLVNEHNLQYADINALLSTISKGVDIADIINDDVFAWMTETEKINLQRDWLAFQKQTAKDKKSDEGRGFIRQLFITLAPYIFKSLLAASKV